MITLARILIATVLAALVGFAIHVFYGQELAMDEYEIEPDRKLYWADFLTILAAQIDKLEDDQGTDWRVGIINRV